MGRWIDRSIDRIVARSILAPHVRESEDFYSPKFLDGYDKLRATLETFKESVDELLDVFRVWRLKREFLSSDGCQGKSSQIRSSAPEKLSRL